MRRHSAAKIFHCKTYKRRNECNSLLLSVSTLRLRGVTQIHSHSQCIQYPIEVEPPRGVPGPWHMWMCAAAFTAVTTLGLENKPHLLILGATVHQSSASCRSKGLPSCTCMGTVARINRTYSADNVLLVASCQRDYYIESWVLYNVCWVLLQCCDVTVTFTAYCYNARYHITAMLVFICYIARRVLLQCSLSTATMIVIALLQCLLVIAIVFIVIWLYSFLSIAIAFVITLLNRP